MTGHELEKLMESNVFRSTVMDTIINEFVPAPDSFYLTDSFMPFKLVSKEKMLDLINHGAFGKTHPITLGGEHRRIPIPGYEYKEHVGAHWRESVEFGEDVLQNAINPQRPTEKWGEGLVTTSLNLLDIRLNNLIEHVTSKIIITGKYSEDRHGIKYEYDAKIPSKFMRDVSSSPGWTTGGVWTTASSAKPTQDVIESMRALSKYGIATEKVIMSLKTALDFLNADDTQAKVKASFVLVGRNSDIKYIFQTLTGMPLEIDTRVYLEESRFTAASAAADDTLEVEDASVFATGDTITLRNSTGDEEEATISSISGNIITISAGVSNAYAIGDRVQVSRQFLPDNYYILKGRLNQRVAPNNWISTPSLIKSKSWKDPLPGRYTWKYFQTKVPYKLEIGAGISGGPKISACTWMRVKTG